MTAPVNFSTAILKEASVLEGATSDPDKGTPAVDAMTYKVEGPYVMINWAFEEDASATAGSGTYLLKLPASLEADASFVNISATKGANTVGNCFVVNSNGTPVYGVGFVQVYDSTHLAMVVNNTFVGSAYLGLNSADKPVKYLLEAMVPVTNRNYEF